MQIGIGNGITFPRPASIGGFTPLSPASSREWWKISDDSTIVPGSGTASAVLGQAGLLNLSQGTPSNQPALGGTIGSNAIHALTFAGNEWLGVADTLSQPFTVATICQTTSPNTQAALVDFDGSTVNNWFGIQSANNWRIDVGSFVNFSATTSVAARVLLLEVNGATSRLYFNGSLVASASAGSNGVTAWLLGARGVGPVGWNGTISDTAIYSGILSAGDRSSVTAYLGDLAGIAVV